MKMAIFPNENIDNFDLRPFDPPLVISVGTELSSRGSIFAAMGATALRTRRSIGSTYAGAARTEYMLLGQCAHGLHASSD